MQENYKKEARKTDSLFPFLQDNAPTHTTQVAMAAATECGFLILPHPSYSINKAPSDFYIFPKLHSHIRGSQNGSNEGVI